MWPSKVIRTFVRDAELLQLLRVKRQEGLFVIERHEGFPERSFFFPDMPTLETFERELIEDLNNTGWMLVDVWPERRSGTERRRHNGRSGPERRRQSTQPPKPS
jgi:hypothetical protein